MSWELLCCLVALLLRPLELVRCRRCWAESWQLAGSGACESCEAHELLLAEVADNLEWQRHCPTRFPRWKLDRNAYRNRGGGFVLHLKESTTFAWWSTPPSEWKITELGVGGFK